MMISTQRIIYCINAGCDRPINSIGDSVCANCQTPLLYRYLWATCSLAANIPPGTIIAERYEVIAPQIWLDTQPGTLPDISPDLPSAVIPYLKLYQQHLHLPQAYGYAPTPETEEDDILLLENVPIDETGNLYPTIAAAWEQATAVRQVYWLWQMLQLWQPLSELGVEQSLLIPDNLRVQGWCVRLVELHPTPADAKFSLGNLAKFWQSWIASAQPQISQSLQNIVEQMGSTANFTTIVNQLNTLLLASAAELPLSLQVAGSSDTGIEPMHNEDTCYPNLNEPYDPLIPRLSMVCDGIGGHKGGEVASQMAVQSLKLQIRALLKEVAEQTEPVTPNLLQEQLEASLRVVNNLICSRNDEHKRQGRERMATTLVMGLQLPQRIATISGWQSDNAHELYLANIGDSRAYWITRHNCRLLTVDDDVAWREVRCGRSLYRQAWQRIDASALTQALGTKDAESLRLVIQRFIIDEEGILLLCSDGLSDNNLVEKSWQDFAIPLLNGEVSVAETVQNLINFANKKNGHDNISVVVTLCRLTKEYLVPVSSLSLPVEIIQTETPEVEEPVLIETPLDAETAEVEEPTLTESAQALLDLNLTEEPTPPIPTIPAPIKQRSRRQPILIIVRLLALVIGSVSLGLLAWWQIHPQSFQQMRQEIRKIYHPQN